MKDRKYQWILLDLDNTLFDFNTSSVLAFHSLLSDLDIPASNGLYEDYKKINKDVWQQLEMGHLTSAEVKWKRFEAFFDHIGFDRDPHHANEVYLDHLVDHFRFIDDAQEVIQYLKQFYNLGVVTNGLQKVQRARLEKSGISNAFDVIVISEEIGTAKPQKEYFDEAFRKMNYPVKEQVMIVGDNLTSDIKGGLDYGIDTCWYNHEKQHNNLGLKPRYEIKQLKTLIEMF